MENSEASISTLIFKAILVGPMSVGKSSLLLRVSQNSFSQKQLPTVGIDYKAATTYLGNNFYTLQIWDTAGAEKFRSLTRSYYKGAHCCICVFDVNSEESLTQCDYYLEQALAEKIPSSCVLLFGNKADIGKTFLEKGQAMANKLGIAFGYGSAKTGFGLNQALESLTASLVQEHNRSGTNRSQGNIRLVNDVPQGRSRCSC